MGLIAAEPTRGAQMQLNGKLPANKTEQRQ
jgi:hypothetical protein